MIFFPQSVCTLRGFLRWELARVNPRLMSRLSCHLGRRGMVIPIISDDIMIFFRSAWFRPRSWFLFPFPMKSHLSILSAWKFDMTPQVLAFSYQHHQHEDKPWEADFGGTLNFHVTRRPGKHCAQEQGLGGRGANGMDISGFFLRNSPWISDLMVI